jgi:hypothetical protein
MVRVEREWAYLLGVVPGCDAVVVWERIPYLLTPRNPSDGIRAFDMGSGAERYETASQAELGFADEVRASFGGRWVALLETYKSPLESTLESVRARLPVAQTIGAGHTSVGVYDASTGRYCGRVMDVHFGSAPLLSPDGRTLAVQREDLAIELWDVPPRKSLTWFLAAAALLALPLAWLARRRVRRLAGVTP